MPAAVLPPRLHTADLLLILVYLIGITLFGLRFRKSSKDPAARSLKSYFLANNTIPWWAIALSIVSAETSTLTIISIPGVAFTGDFGFLQIVIGYMLGRIVVALLFLPRYFQGSMLTAYQLIDQRFGPTLHKVTAGLFLLTRAAAEGVRVFAVSIVVAIAIGTNDTLSIAIISLLTLLYTFEGGMAAVIWTDVVQMAIYIGGTLVAIATLGSHVPGGWQHIHAVTSAAGKLTVFHFALNLTQTYTFWAGVLGGTFLTMASHGTDQLMVQRMLAARNLRESRLALLSSGAVILLQFTLFLLIGAGLWVFYRLYPQAISSPDRIFPTFIVTQMPIGIAGLLIAAILAAAMSNLSAALNSLSSTTVVDFYMHWRPKAPDRERMIISRSSTVLWALVLFGIAVYSIHAGGKGHVVETGLSIASVAYGCLLGVFLLGTLTKYATQTGTIIGMITGFALNLLLWFHPTTMTLGPLTIPHIAFTWYVLIGSIVTFAIGSLASLVFRKQAIAKAVVAAALLLCITSPLRSQTSQPITQSPQPTAGQQNGQAPDFAQVTTLINAAISDHKLPGAVVVIGHNGKIVFEQAFGVRKLAGEPGPDGQPSAAEPMTEDTIFDMASLTKCLATATAIMQLYEAHKLDFDDPVAKYLPEFATNGKQDVTIRELLTHYSGLPEDVSLKDDWGLKAPDKAEGIRRAMQSTLYGPPGVTFKYSDINFITLGALVEKLSGQSLDEYVHEHIFKPLQMEHTSYHSLDHICAHSYLRVGSATIPDRNHAELDLIGADIPKLCAGSLWNIESDFQTAPTAHDNEGTSDTNPDFDHLLRGTVHDPTARRMGGVAGHAGVFSTAHDISLFAQAFLDRLLTNTGPFPLKQSTLQLMTRPQQPPTAESGETIFTPDGQPTKGVAARGFGWDINTAFSRPRGSIFPIATQTHNGSFGHTGFTGTSLWIDPVSSTYVILLANAIHPRVGPNISALRGQVATAAAQALGITPESERAYWSCNCTHCEGCPGISVDKQPVVETIPADPSQRFVEPAPSEESVASQTNVLTGIDTLETTKFAALKTVLARHRNALRLGLFTNQAGLDAMHRRTIDILYGDAPKALPGLTLNTLFSPEHGLLAAVDNTHISDDTDPATHLPIISLYGAKPSDRHPSHEALKNLDAVVIDLQDVGVRFWTYEAAVGYFLEAAATERTQYHHTLDLLILDRPNPIGGTQIEGPVSDANQSSYTAYMPLPVRHGLTLGELANYFNAQKNLDVSLTVVPMEYWRRDQYFDSTGLLWTNPSPNLRSPTAAILYPGVGLIEQTNVSVGRGTTTPFEHFGAPWINAPELAAYLTARHIPGIAFTATTLTVAEDSNHYPSHGQTIPGIHLSLTDPAALDSPELGIELLAALHHLYPTQFELSRAAHLVANTSVMQALNDGEDPHAIAAAWTASLEEFRNRSRSFLLYR